MNLQLGGLSLSVGRTGTPTDPSRLGNTVEAGMDNVKELGSRLIGRVRKGIEEL